MYREQTETEYQIRELAKGILVGMLAGRIYGSGQAGYAVTEAFAIAEAFTKHADMRRKTAEFKDNQNPELVTRDA